MRLAWKHRVTSILVLLTVTNVNQHPARAEAPPPFQFTQTYPLAVDWKRVQKEGIEVEIQNNSQDKQILTIQLTLYELRDLKGNILEFSKVLRPERDSVTLDKPSALGEIK